jgi:hypothetical protein
MAVNGTVLRLAQTIGPVLAGIAFATGGLSGVYTFGAFMAASMAALILARGLR